MNPIRFSATRVPKYLGALVTISATTSVLFLLRGGLNPPIVALLYLLPVGLSTALWGLGPGLASAALAFLTFNFFFILPYYTFRVHQTQDLLVLVIFLFVAVVISQMLGRVQASLTQAQAREREATHLYELSAALAGLQSERAIAHTLAEHLRQAFQAAAVEVTVQAGPTSAPTTTRLPEDVSPPALSPLAVPLTTPRSALGEIRIWRDSGPFDPAETRLLRTIASQVALALERARLAQAESRARILEESDRLKSALLSSVSHELRTPLATIKAAADSLRTGAVDWDSAAREDLIAVVDEEADHLNRLVGNLLQMSRIEAGALTLQKEWNLLAEIVGNALGRLRRATALHRLEVDVPDSLPLLPVDAVLMEQVFTNLISNCLKYAPPGTLIRIQAGMGNDQTLDVRVSNQGPPVPDEHLDHIFDKFYRITYADRVTGTGLGLSICKGIVEAHGGRIWAENLPDGFAFRMRLPLHWTGARPPRLPADSETA